MTDTDLATGGGDDAFTAEEQAAFDAYERGDDAPAAPAGGEEPTAAAPAAPEVAAPAGGPAAAPGEVVDPDAEDADDPEANKGRFVRHGAFHKERERRKAEATRAEAAERELTDLRERFARGDERMRILTEAMQRPAQPAAAPAAQPEPVPDPNDDIFGYVKHLEKQLSDIATGQKTANEAQQRQAEQARAEREHQAVVSSYQQDVARFAQAEPAFAEGYTFLIQGRIAELKHFGATDAEAVQAVQADELALIQAARAKGVSPAEHVYAMAKLRGFSPKAAAPAAPAAPAETPAERAARTAAGQDGPGRSLSAAGGAPAGEVTMEMLASMSEADFEKYAAQHPNRVRALMGG